MAPLTRGHRARAEKTGENIEPLSPALTAHTLTPTRSADRNHLRFDKEDTPTITQRGGIGIDANDTSGTQTNSHPADEIADSQDDADSDSDDDAPEAVSMGAGKQAAEKREEEARKAAEAQKEAMRKKRKERDTKLKEQKAEAEARKESKRRKLDDTETTTTPQPALGAAVAERDESTNATIEKPKTPLLPESLLAEASAHSEAVDDSEDSDKDIGGATVTPQVPSVKLEKNRRRREQKKRNKVLKKGVVNVKVLKDEAASRKVMAPPASKRVENIKETWLFARKGGFSRRSVGGGFVKRK